MNMQTRMKTMDADSHRVVTVKKQDLEGAICSDHQRCVIARAIKREFKAEFVDVGAETVFIKMPGHIMRRYKLTDMAREQVKYFDESGAFAPCYVELKPPATSDKHEVRAAETKKYRARKKANLVVPKPKRQLPSR